MLGALLLDATATGPGNVAGPAHRGVKTVQAYVSGVGSVSLTVQIQVSDFDPTVYASSWVTAATFTIVGTGVATDLATLPGNFEYWRANVTAISGTSARATVMVKQ